MGTFKFHQQGSPLDTESEAGMGKGKFPALGPGARFPGLLTAQFLFCWMQMRLPSWEETSTQFFWWVEVHTGIWDGKF